MELGHLSKLKRGAADELCREFELSPDAAALLTPEQSVIQFFAALHGAALWDDAAKVMAYALPKRQAVWWAFLCAESTIAPDAPEAERAALDAAEQWVRRQDDETRRDAFTKAQTAGFDAPASWAAVAAFWSGGSIAPADCPDVPPGPTLTAKAVAGAVALSAVAGDPAQAADRRRAFVTRGVDIANGGAGRVDG